MEAPSEPALARARAAHAIARALDGRYLDAVLDEMRRGAAGANMPLTQELAYGTLRWYHQLTGIAHLFLAHPFKQKDTDVYALLLCGLYELRELHTPQYAAV